VGGVKRREDINNKGIMCNCFVIVSIYFEVILVWYY
jgi:hypothetical protein